MPRNERGKVGVVLDIFSGRPNPSWELSRNQVKTLTEMLSFNKEDEVDPVEPPILGFRGFNIVNRDQLPGIPYAVRVYEGVITVKVFERRKKEKISSFKDLNGVEEWLLKQAEKRGYGEVIEKFRISESSDNSEIQ